MKVLEEIRRHVSRHLGFLRWIALDMPDKSPQDFFLQSKSFMKTFPPGAYKFVCLGESTPGLESESRPSPSSMDDPTTCLLEQLVTPDDRLSDEMQQRVAVAIDSAIIKACSVHLTEEHFDKLSDTHAPALCLQTGELRVNVGQNFTTAFGDIQYNGPLIRFKATETYIQNLRARRAAKTEEYERDQRAEFEISEDQPPNAKRVKLN
jgi:hypothetical protein